MNSKKIISTIIVLCSFVLVGLRIWYVNDSARTSQIVKAKQGEKVVYNGFSYTIINAEMMDYESFFMENQEYGSYYISSDYQRKVIVVDMMIEKMEDDSRLYTYLPINYEYVFNGFDVFLFNKMNPSLAEGTFKSGDIITIVYEIYEENLTEEQWNNVENTTYKIIFGVYPIRTEVELTDIKK